MSTPTIGTSSQQSKPGAQSKPSKGDCCAHEERKETQQAIQKKPSPLLSQRTEIAQPKKKQAMQRSARENRGPQHEKPKKAVNNI
jgi:hypothetical protein